MGSCTVEQYSHSKFGEILDKYSHNGDGHSRAKSHLAYFDEYLTAIGTKTIIIEHPYTDRDYLEDYAAYYARCFDDYSKHCARLHFFSTDFDNNLIEKHLSGDRSVAKVLQSHYLGFTVVKPLPWSVIGRTCLVTYKSGPNRRCFDPTRDYKVHLLGMELEVRSLAFQEQDTDVAACATSALWSLFNATGVLFQHDIPSPAEITNAATASLRMSNRVLPAANGLSAEQIADAIRSVGLEPVAIGAANLNFLRIAGYAYLRSRIPFLLLGSVFEPATSKPLGSHAITVAGFQDPVTAPTPFGTAGTLFRATAIQKFYAHDDQVGPFARLTFDNKVVGAVCTSLRDGNAAVGNVYFSPEMILVPLYHKIRLEVQSPVATISALDVWLEKARKAAVLPISDQLQWDLYLSTNTALLEDVYSDTALIPLFRSEMLQRDLPRFIWRASASVGGQKQFELLLDATDLLQGRHVIGALPYSRPTCSALAVFASNPAVMNYIGSTGNRPLLRVLKWFEDRKADF